MGPPENPRSVVERPLWSLQTRGHSWDPQSACHLFPGPGDPRVEQQLQAEMMEGLGPS